MKLILRDKIKGKGLSLFVGMVVFAMFTVCATTSPLYSFCDESHCFFSVGKAILNGRVLYRDILEQKGLLIYLIQIPAYLISHTTFLGVWIIQSLLIIISFYYNIRSASILLRNKYGVLISVSVLYLVIFTCDALGSAQTVEVYLLPCFSYSIYCSLKYLEVPEKIPPYVLILNGIMAGIVLWTKYSLLGFYFAWMATICIFLLFRKTILEAFEKGVFFIIGMIGVSIPCLVYFYVNNSIAYLIKFYFLNNMQSYGEEAKSFLGVLKGYIEAVIVQLKWNPILLILLLIGVIYIIFNNELESIVKINILLSAVFQYMIVYLHGPMYSYYFYAFAPFGVFGVCGLLCFCKRNLRLNNIRIGTVCLIAVLCLIISYYLKPSPRRFLDDSSKLAQYKFAEIMTEQNDPTLLEYGYLDGGFYTVADIVPNTWAYCKLNWNNKEMINDQKNTLKKCLVDYVVVRSDVEIPTELTENYHLIAEHTQYRKDTLYTYYLYQLNGN